MENSFAVADCFPDVMRGELFCFANGWMAD